MKKYRNDNMGEGAEGECDDAFVGGVGVKRAHAIGRTVGRSE